MDGQASEWRALPRPGTERYVKAWPAYITPFLLFVVIAGLGFLVGFLSKPLGEAVGLLAALVLILNTLAVRAVVLWFDDNGVWVFSGLFPWSKGVQGVKWRDVEDAVFIRTFASWLCGSYTVRVRHRFTKSSEILLDNMRHGEVAVERINDHLRQMLATAPR